MQQGSGISVIEQNIFNTETSMKCNGAYSKSQIENAITQQKYFFDYITHQSNAKKLDKFTSSIAKDTLISGWLFQQANMLI